MALEQAGNVVPFWARVKGYGVVGLLAVEVVMDPEVLLGLGEVYPFSIAERHKRDLRRAA